MINRMFANKTVRKICVFAVSFVATGIMMGGLPAVTPDAMTSAKNTQAVEARQLSEKLLLRTSAFPDFQYSVVFLGDLEKGSLAGMVQKVSNDEGETLDYNQPDEDYGMTLNIDQWEDKEDLFPAMVGHWSDEDAPDVPDTSNFNLKAIEEEVKKVTPNGFVYREEIPMDHDLQVHTYEKCLANGVDYGMVLALIWRESRFNAEAVHVNSNGTKDTGIMQINDVNRTWIKKELGIENLLDPFQNVSAGTAMLGRLVSKYGEHNALMAYQYGEQGMKNRLKQGITTSKQIQQLYAKRLDFYNIIGGK